MAGRLNFVEKNDEILSGEMQNLWTEEHLCSPLVPL
jgi:hypothetical protein